MFNESASETGESESKGEGTDKLCSLQPKLVIFVLSGSIETMLSSASYKNQTLWRIVRLESVTGGVCSTRNSWPWRI